NSLACAPIYCYVVENTQQREPLPKSQFGIRTVIEDDAGERVSQSSPRISAGRPVRRNEHMTRNTILSLALMGALAMPALAQNQSAPSSQPQATQSTSQDNQTNAQG